MSLSLGASAASLYFAAAVLWAAIADVVTMKIRNELVLVLLAGYVILAPLAGMGWADVGWSVTGAASVLAGMFVLFSFGWIGGGDAKFAAVIALWLGADQALAFVLCTALFGGILTILLLQFRLSVLPAQCLSVSWIMRLHAPQTGVPYGVAIAAAALFIFPDTYWMRALT
ncbi:prepilin peptidase [Microvirga terrae]|uniref:Prepilin peptidase n=1 Tax=Microvirga terrae TaxID=2740529 RepID=A0ABY5RNY6_9HYPH|nr:prepilin peptidase [Microvirga terrae]UVF18497.1 prepilin peptidase [Microvirga terrae]